MKKNSLQGIYPGLRLEKNQKGEYFIKITDEFKSNTLLFEMRGKIVSNKFFKDNRDILIKKKYVFFQFFSGQNFYQYKNILILNKDNIAFFMKKGNNYESNVNLKAFVKENDLVTLLCISSKDIPVNSFIISNNIFNFLG